MDDHRTQNGERPRTTEVRWAWVRTVSGWLQMAGAAAAVVLLVRTGASTATVAIVCATAVVTVVSVLLFRVLKLPGSGGRSS